MHWLFLCVGLMRSVVVGQRWADSVILTQHGPVAYKPVHHPRYGYYTADVLPVYPGDDKLEPVRPVPWPPYGNTFEMPITTGLNVGHPALLAQLKPSSIPMKRKKSTLKKNPYYHKIPQYEKPNIKITTPRQKQTLESSYDQRFNIRNPVQSGYTYRGRRFVNRGLKVRQSEKILKGQVIDHNNKGREYESHRPQSRSFTDDVETEASQNRVNLFFNNGHQKPDLGYYQYSPTNRENGEDSASYYTSKI